MGFASLNPSYEPSEQIEIFTVLPFRDLVRFRFVRGLLAAARDLRLLEVDVVAHEGLAEAVTKADVLAQRRERFGKCCRQRLGRGAVWCIGGGAGLELARHAVEPGVDLRGHVEIGIGEWLSHAVLEMGRGIAGIAHHAHHDAAIVLRPDGLDRRHRIHAVIALVAVECRRRECGRSTRVRQQPGEEVTAERGERSLAVLRGEDIRLGFRIEQRLMQMPSARQRVRQARPTHEAHQMAVPSRHLLQRAAEQHHRICGRHAALGRERELILARPEFDLQRAQRQA